jgi:hypothetical protein
MGLDWILNKTKARPGSESRFAELSVMVERMKEEGADPGPTTEAELEAVSMSCFEVLGTPRVGIDEEATEFFRTEVYEPARADAEKGEGNSEFQAYWMRPYEKVLEENRGKWVVELAKEKGGVATVGGMLTGALDFRGKVVGRSEAIIGDALASEAYEDHSAEQCLSYAKRLEEALGERQDEDVKYLRDAISWLRFWGERGFGYWAWA